MKLYTAEVIGTMTKYHISTTTHDKSGRQVDAWEGDYVEAENRDDAIAEAVEHEAGLLQGEVENIATGDNWVSYTKDGEEYEIWFAVDDELTKIYNEWGTEIWFSAAVDMMDDGIREELHREMVGECTESEFFQAYAEKHLEKYGEEFEPAKENPVW